MEHALSCSRRTFLKKTFAGSFALLCARIVPSWAGKEDLPTGVTLEFFSPHEYRVVQAVAARIIGVETVLSPGIEDINVALRADAFLAAADPEQQEQFHLLLKLFNAPFFTFLFDLRLSSFLGMPPSDQDSYLADWMTSNLAFRRTGFQALKRLCLSMYYSDERSWQHIGYHGMFLPWER